jgi:ribonuclease Y
MNSSLYVIIGLLIGVGVGIIVGRFLLRKLFKSQENQAQNKVKLILKDAENNAEILKKNKLLEAKERFLQLKAEHEQELNAKNNAYQPTRK